MILVTGASGFVGSRLCQCLADSGHAVRMAVRKHSAGGEDAGIISELVMGNIGSNTDWGEALCSVDAVVHLAAHVHCSAVSDADANERFMEVNVLATERLARQAAEAGVRRFIFLSSVKVNGESTAMSVSGCGAYTESDPPAPEDAYSASKWEAEQCLRAIGVSTGMEIVILRPPLVYGPGAKANLWRLLRLVEKGLPLPFGSMYNSRSLVYLDNLVDCIILCLEHPAAVGQTFFVTDGEDLSTPDLMRRLGSAMGKSVRLFACPLILLRWVASIFGYSAEMNRLCGSLQVDSGKVRNLLGWSPRFTVDHGIMATVKWYLHCQND